MNTEECVMSEVCNECGGVTTVTRGDYRFDEMGLPLILSNIEIIKCDGCGTSEPVITHMNELMHTVALAVICQPCKLRGEEVKFLRRYLGKSAKEFAALLHLDKSHMSKLENNKLKGGTGKQTDKLIRLLVLNLSPELKDKISELIEMMPGINDDPCTDPSDIRIDPATMRYQYA